MEALEKRLTRKYKSLHGRKKRVEAEIISEKRMKQQRLIMKVIVAGTGRKGCKNSRRRTGVQHLPQSKEKTIAMEYATAAGGSADDARQYAQGLLQQVLLTQTQVQKGQRRLQKD